MNIPGWMTAIRATIRLGKELHIIGVQLKRIADHFEGIEPPPREAPPEDHTMVVASRQSDEAFAHFERVEARLTKVLGRAPTPEELGRELDGEEHDPRELERAFGDRRPDLHNPYRG